MSERWFEPEELEQLSRPTMDRAIEAIEAGDLEAAKMPIEWSGYPLHPSDPPEDFNTDPCTWYWYKDRDAIPDRHWERYGAVKP